MTIRRMVDCALLSVCLLIVACGTSPDKQGENQPANTKTKTSAQDKGSSTLSPARPPAPIDWSSAKKSVDDASAKLNTPKESPQQPTIKQVLEDISKAINKLGKDEGQIERSCGSCREDVLGKAKNAWGLLTGVTKTLEGEETRKVVDLSLALSLRVKDALKNASQDIQDAGELSAESTTSGGSNNGNSSASETTKSERDTNEPDWLWLALEFLAGIIALTLIGAGVLMLRKRSWAKFDTHLNDALLTHVGPLRKQQSDLAAKLSALASSHDELGNRFGDIQTELRSVGRLVRDAAVDGGGRRPSASASSAYNQVEQPTPRDEPVFPMAAIDYLGKMQRFANVVRPDFQNGILVVDPDGKGEFVLIKDSKLADDAQPLLIIPRATHFQTKQDFYTYYEKYYECAKPSAGEVWIVDPAIVRKVQGGWQLTEKGVLELR